MINDIIKLLIVLATILWISFTIYVIIPKLTGTEMTIGLSMVLGLVTGSFTWLEKLKLDEIQRKREHELRMFSLKASEHK